MICFIGNRPAIQIGTHQVLDYDTAWLEEAIHRAARAADYEDFPLVSEIRNGVELYLENKCSLRLLSLNDLFARMRFMLAKIGCERIAEKLEPLAPPLTISLIAAAHKAGNGFELAFFEILRSQLSDLRANGAEQFHFIGIQESVMILHNTATWSTSCDKLLAEIQSFLASIETEPSYLRSSHLLSSDLL